MSTIEKSIDVQVPVRTVYHQWTQFTEFPKFMEWVLKVTRLDNERVYWRANVGGKEKEWEAVITEQIPNTRIAWRSTKGTQNAGVVTFQRLSNANDATRVTVQIEYDPEGLVEEIGDLLGVLTRQIEKDLIRFKMFIEDRVQETDAGREEIPQEKQEER